MVQHGDASTARRALVVGAGISGLAVAGALTRVGFTVEVVEKEDEVRALGSGITLISPALKAMHDLGIYDECVSQGYEIYDFETYTTTGELVSSFTPPSMVGPGEPGMLGMMRPALHRILHDHAAKSGVRVRASTSIGELTQADDYVDVTFSSGDSARYELVVGADGLRSTVRELCFGPVDSEFVGQGTLRIVLPRPADLTAEVQFHPAGEVFAGFTPTGPESMYMYVSFPVGDDDERDQDLVALARQKLEPFGGYAAIARDRILRDDQINFSKFRTLVAPEPWSRGRVVLVGDAAHCPTPQLAAGAAMCLEDAVILAAELAEHAEVADALTRFSARRYPRCAYIVETAKVLSYWQTHPGTPGADHEGLTADAFRLLAGVS